MVESVQEAHRQRDRAARYKGEVEKQQEESARQKKDAMQYEPEVVRCRTEMDEVKQQQKLAQTLLADVHHTLVEQAACVNQLLAYITNQAQVATACLNTCARCT